MLMCDGEWRAEHDDGCGRALRINCLSKPSISHRLACFRLEIAIWRYTIAGNVSRTHGTVPLADTICFDSRLSDESSIRAQVTKSNHNS